MLASASEGGELPSRRVNFRGIQGEARVNACAEQALNNTTKEEGDFFNEVTFSSSVADASGLQYMNARFYEPQTGRFITQDSYTGNPYDPWTQHLYSYCNNNPINMIDPTGHSARSVVYMDSKGFYIYNNNKERVPVFDYVAEVTTIIDVQNTHNDRESNKKASAFDQYLDGSAQGVGDSLYEIAYTLVHPGDIWEYIKKVNNDPGILLLDIINMIGDIGGNLFSGDPYRVGYGTGQAIVVAGEVYVGGKIGKAIGNKVKGLSNSAKSAGSNGLKFGSTTKSIEKLTKQMSKRGWTETSVKDTVNNAFTTRGSKNLANNSPATAYFNKDGSYVVVDNVTKEVVQISNRLDPKWIPDSNIINPYKP